MNVLRICGQTRLTGEVAASGSKNAALPIMAASLLASEAVRLTRVPELTDIRTLSRLLQGLGLFLARRGDEVLIETRDERPTRAENTYVRRMRASFCVLGSLLARRGQAIVPLPGGCKIGDRPIDLHLRGLSALGADIAIRQGCVVARARGLTGARVHLAGARGPTVTGTANVLSAAVLARGTTLITGAAREPEIVDLGRFLQALGARIDGVGTGTIRVRGVDQLGGGTYQIIPDRIETATLLLAAAMTRGSIRVTDTNPAHLTAMLDRLSDAGAAVETTGDSIRLAMCGRPKPVSIVARPHPGVPTDLQAQWTAFMCLARGQSLVRDAVFPERFDHVSELSRLGASLCRQGDSVCVRGTESLTGGIVRASDLRASAAMVLAGLAASGETTVTGLRHLDRGYERLEEKLSRLGASIERTASVCRVGTAHH
ncbi:MAG TPA: UDP-N-acetylglucosamine 1-carboxyvinyltransferase [Pirellulales bacterium]|nr:UDP-N-acetylglucosamine 1-carboxyvinyltransferase [Pirellulales bacterium]